MPHAIKLSERPLKIFSTSVTRQRANKQYCVIAAVLCQAFFRKDSFPQGRPAVSNMATARRDGYVRAMLQLRSAIVQHAADYGSHATDG